MTNFNAFEEKISSDFIDIKRYTQKKQSQFESLICSEIIPNEVKAIAASGKRIGYIIRTCCPFTKADIELAQQAVKALNLDKLVFIIWPFRYINGYQSTLLESSDVKTQPPVWEERMEILRYVLDQVKDNKLTILEASKDWYSQSQQMFDPNDTMNPFWTGTWFVIRKLQYYLGNKDFFYCCGEDQFNPNIYPLINEGQEKIWKDYSILQQLALHHVFVVPKGKEPQHKFVAPTWSPHKVFFGTKLNNGSIPKSRTNKTLNMMNVGCVGGVANYLIQMGYLKKQIQD